MPPHTLTNFEIIEFFKYEPIFNGVYSRNNLPKFKKGAYVINLDHSENTGTHWVAVFVKKDEVIYFDSFGFEHVPEEIKKSIGNKSIKSNIFRTQDYNSVMCGYFCILLIELMLEGKKLTDFTNLFTSWDLKKNDEIVSRYFKLPGVTDTLHN